MLKLFFLILILSFTNLHAQKSYKAGSLFPVLKSRAKEVIEKTYESPKEPTKKLIRNRVFTYNQQGDIIGFTNTPDHRSDFVYTYKYNAKGKKTECTRYINKVLSSKYFLKYDNKDSLIENIIEDKIKGEVCIFLYKLDTKSNRIAETNYYVNKVLQLKYVYKYDTKGNQIEEREYKADGTPGLAYLYKYDTKGNQIEERRYKADGTLENTFSYKYNTKRKKIEERRYKADGSLGSKCTYNEMGCQTERVEYNLDSTLTIKEVEKYDVKGNEIEWNMYKADGSFLFKKRYTYDNKGNEIGWIMYNLDGTVNFKERYTYDTKNNLILAEHIINDKVINQTEYTINY